MQKGFGSSDQFFIETPAGILTRRGEWFHTTRKQIEDFAPGLLDHVSFKEIIKEAQAWVQSPASFSLIQLYILLFLINPWIAAIISLVFHWCWYHYKSAFVVYGAGTVLRVINSDVFMYIIALVCLSALGITHHTLAAIIGIILFVVMKPGLLKKGWKRLQRLEENQLTLNDRVLKMIIIKHAMHENIAVSEIDKMEEHIQNFTFSRKEQS
jgi:hypothetical protein